MDELKTAEQIWIESLDRNGYQVFTAHHSRLKSRLAALEAELAHERQARQAERERAEKMKDALEKIAAHDGISGIDYNHRRRTAEEVAQAALAAWQKGEGK